MTTTEVAARLGRWRAERLADALLISFPKCGRTWLRLMVGRAIALHEGMSIDEPAALIDLRGLTGGRTGIPRVLVTHDDKPHLRAPEDLQRTKRRYRRKLIVLLVRDPRDVMVSLYFERTKRDRRHPYTGSLSEFLREPIGGIASLVTFYNIWADQWTTPRGFLLVRYEDMHQAPERELRRVLDFLGLQRVPDAVVVEAAGGATFEKMRAMESQGLVRSGKLRPGSKEDLESYKTREGKVGAYHRHLASADIAFVEEHMAALSDLFGYRPSPAAGH